LTTLLDTHDVLSTNANDMAYHHSCCVTLIEELSSDGLSLSVVLNTTGNDNVFDLLDTSTAIICKVIVHDNIGGNLIDCASSTIA
jgi:hypothetical protein